jgi:shikimate dehydrogenase
MTDRYCVFGNPIGHSQSPRIHAAFAQQTGQDLVYEARLAPRDGFAHALRTFAAEGGRGANVTLPFKQEAHALATGLTLRAAVAKAVNTLTLRNGTLAGDNTDGAGLVTDLNTNVGFQPAGKRILLLGAGGAARGVLLPLLNRMPRTLVIANRTAARAEELAVEFEAVARHHASGSPTVAIGGCGFAHLAGAEFDLVINATAASLSDEAPALPAGLFAAGSLAYDMMYGKGLTPFLSAAREQGAARLVDGLGMLVEQAAEAFFVWRGVRPDTAPVLAALRGGESA